VIFLPSGNSFHPSPASGKTLKRKIFFWWAEASRFERKSDCQDDDNLSATFSQTISFYFRADISRRNTVFGKWNFNRCGGEVRSSLG
jgi:hypothetical protein